MGKQRRGAQRSLGEMLDLSQWCRPPTCEGERKEGWIGRVLGGSAVLTNFQLGLCLGSPSEIPIRRVPQFMGTVCLSTPAKLTLWEQPWDAWSLCSHSDAFRCQQLELSVNYAFGSRRSESPISWPSSFLPFSPCFPSFLFSVKMSGVLFRL